MRRNPHSRRAWTLPLLVVALLLTQAGVSAAAVAPLPRYYANPGLIRVGGHQQLLLKSLEVIGVTGRMIHVGCNRCLRTNTPIAQSFPTPDIKLYQNVNWRLPPGKVVRIVLFKNGEVGRYLLLAASVSAHPRLVLKGSGCVSSLTAVVRCPPGTSSPRSGTPVQRVPVTHIVMVTVTGPGLGEAVRVSNAGLISSSRTCSSQRGTSVCSLQYVAGSSVTFTPVPVANAVFAGWSGGCAGTGPCTLPVNVSLSVTATFTLVSHALTLDYAGAGSGTVQPAGTGYVADSQMCTNGVAPCSYRYAAGSTVTLTPTAAASSVFTGWSGACSGNGTCTVVLDGDKTVTAAFAIVPRTLTYSFAGDGNGTVSPTTGGYIAGSASCTNQTPNVCSAKYAQGSSVGLGAVAAEGSTFVGWSGACSGTGNCIVTLSGDVSVTATFALVTYTLTLSLTGPGTLTGSAAGYIPGSNSCNNMTPDVCTSKYVADTLVTVVASPSSGATFTGWSGACTGLQPCNVRMTGDETVAGTFVKSP